MQVGLMGGTFDPIHYGHLLAAETAREQAGLDEIWFIPSFMPPLKEGRQPGAAAEERLEMVFRAIDFQPYFRAMDIELGRGGTSYTIDTITELQEQYPDRAFSFIIGSDRLNDLDRWHRSRELAEMVSFIALERPGVSSRLEELPDYLQSKVQLCQMPLMDISSTDIRNRRKAGRSIRFLTPDKVHRFIIRNGLYES
ncbi:nicotinate-nucleotide adenylyltransferase [Paenibacillaceae bacterium]|nr:nicotinate-nucleotide adenylyltransferase [Paenibacillaceae bacterium]